MKNDDGIELTRCLQTNNNIKKASIERAYEKKIIDLDFWVRYHFWFYGGGIVKGKVVI